VQVDGKEVSASYVVVTCYDGTHIHFFHQSLRKDKRN